VKRMSTSAMITLTACIVLSLVPPTTVADVQTPPDGIWTQFTNANRVGDLTFAGDVLWAATTGGVVRWDTTTGLYSKYDGPRSRRQQGQRLRD